MIGGGLFEGTGGFSLAAHWAGITPSWSNELKRDRCRVLRKKFEHEIIQDDIRNLGKHNLKSVDIIYGGDPCQPNSSAGLRKGKADDRYLWPEKFRIIRELIPSWVVNENVYGSISNGILDIKIDDLESAGYTCQAYCIPAEAVGALHQRERVWLVGYNSNGYRSSHRPKEISGAEKAKAGMEGEQHNIHESWQPVDLWANGAHPDIERLKELNDPTKSGVFPEGVSRYFGFGPNPYGHIPRDVIESCLMGMLNGLPEGMDYADRSKRIGMMGDAIVPQAACELFLGIKKLHDDKTLL